MRIKYGAALDSDNLTSLPSSPTDIDNDIILKSTPFALFGKEMADHNTMLYNTPYDYIMGYNTSVKVNQYRMLYNPALYDDLLINKTNENTK
eukprot:UN04903